MHVFSCTAVRTIARISECKALVFASVPLHLYIPKLTTFVWLWHVNSFLPHAKATQNWVALVCSFHVLHTIATHICLVLECDINIPRIITTPFFSPSSIKLGWHSRLRRVFLDVGVAGSIPPVSSRLFFSKKIFFPELLLVFSPALLPKSP